MELIKILEELLSEVGDASATGFSLVKPNLKGKFLKIIDKINSDKSRKEYGGEEPFKVKYVASIGPNKYNIDISGMVSNVTPRHCPKIYLSV